MKSIEDEFTMMVNQNRKVIYKVCYFYSKNIDEVNDLFQETLINLWRGFENFRGESNIKTWVWRVSLNTCNNYNRNSNRKVMTIPLTVNVDLYTDEDDNCRQVQQLYERIDRLNAFDRAIILLWLENMSYDDIAQIIGISVANVATRLYRIKQQLKSMSNN